MAPQAPALDGEYQELSLDLLDFNTWNPNEMETAESDLLREQIQEVGFIDPAQVVPLTSGRYRVIGGEHRIRALASLGRTVIPCIVLKGPRWQDEDLQKFVTVRLNVLHGKLNPEKMAKLYQEMVAKYGADALQKMFAFTDAQAFKKAVDGVKAGLKRSGLPKSAQQQVGQAKTLDELGKILTTVFDKQGLMLKSGFVAFTYEGADHVYVRMTEPMKKAFDRLMAYCIQNSEDINDIMAPVTMAYVEAITKKPTEKA